MDGSYECTEKRLVDSRKGLSASLGVGRAATWLIDYDGVRTTSQNRGHYWPIVYPPAEIEWRAVMMMMPAGDNS
jgi:hypothetical protein